jgi:hypothetical protein
MPLSVVVMILPPDSTLSVPPDATITPVLVCPELTLRVPPLETVGIAKAPGQQSSQRAAQAGPRPPTPSISGAEHTTVRTRGATKLRRIDLVDVVRSAEIASHPKI